MECSRSSQCQEEPLESRGIINRAGRQTVLHQKMKISVPRGVIDVESYRTADRG